MKIAFVAGFAPIVADSAASRRFYAEALGIPLSSDEYPSTESLPGVKHFGLWPLGEAARSCFAAPTWPSELPVPQAAVEFDVDDVASAAAELEAAGYQLLHGPRTEPWGQTIARLLSPEGLLVGVTYTPWLREGGGP